MKTEKPKKLIRWCILGAIGCGLMAAGDWLLGCVPLQKTDTGLFNRACYLSGSYGLLEARAYRWTGSDWGLSLLLCGKSTECGHRRKNIERPEPSSFCAGYSPLRSL